MTNRPFLATILEKWRGRSLVSHLEGWRRASWNRQLERATEEARRLAEEAKQRNTRGPGR